MADEHNTHRYIGERSMTFPFTVYDPITGKILRTGMAQIEADVAVQGQNGEAVLGIAAAQGAQYIEAGVAVDMSVRPEKNHEYDYAAKSWVFTEDMKAQLWIKVRLDRGEKLSACDWTTLSDSPLTTEVKTAWQTYRQALRDLPVTQADPTNIVWPVAPT